MATLTLSQIANLQAYINAGNISGFYGALESYGDPYGRLGRGVTDNDTWQGQLANNFAASAALRNGVDLSYGSPAWTQLNTNLAQSYLNAYTSNAGNTPAWDIVQGMHNQEYASKNIPADGWFPNRLLNNSANPSALWNDFQSNTGAGDLYGDAMNALQAGANLLFGPYLLYEMAQGDPIEKGKMDFARNFLNALADMTPDMRSEMASDFSPLSGLMNMLGSLGNSIGNWASSLLDGAGWGSPAENSCPIPTKTPDQQASPLVLDLDGDGVEHYAAGAYGTYFDLRNTGQAVLTGWVAPDDGLLAIDTNGNGRIDRGSELFGSSTTDGFTVLKNHDSNNDNVINASDTNFNALRVWRDTNSDGFSQSGELKTLTELGITSINLNARRAPGDVVNGNTITHSSTFTMNGATKQVADVWFGYNPLQTKNATDYLFDIRAAYLPTLKGAGEVKDLHIAASLDNGAGAGTLMQHMMNFAANRTLTGSMVDWTGTKTSIENILLRWGGVDSVVANSRGNYVDARYLAFYEKFRGEAFDQYGRANPLPEAGAYTNAIFAFLVVWEGMKLLAQTSGHEIFTDAQYNPATGLMEGDLGLRAAGVSAMSVAADNAANGADVWARFAQFLGYTKGLSSLTPAEVTMLDQAVAASNVPGMTTWQNVLTHMTVTLGNIIDDPSDWGSFEMFYDIKVNGTNGNDVLVDTTTGPSLNNQLSGKDGDDILRGLTGHDKLIGGAGADRLEGGVGDDLLLGGTGNDTYVYEGGDDTITEENGNGVDTLLVATASGLTQANLTDLYRYGDNLIVLFSNGSRVTIDGYNKPGQSIETIKFEATNHTIDLSALVQQKFYGTAKGDTIDVSGANYQTLLVQGYAGNDTIKANGAAAAFYGGDGYDSLIGSTQNDTLYGEGQDDYLLGGGGNDALHGGDGHDTLDGGIGNDTLNGGAGNNTYLFGTGYGTDTVQRQSGSAANRVEFLNGITTGNLTIDRQITNGSDVDDVTFVTATGDRLVMDDMMARNGSFLYLVKEFRFANGQVWTEQDVMSTYLSQRTTASNDSVYGFERDDTFQSSAGNDYLAGYSGSDTYRWGIGSGQDTIMDQLRNYNNGTNNDRVVITGALTVAGLSFTKTGEDLVIQSLSSTDNLTIKKFYNDTGIWRIERFEFESGSPALTYADIFSMTNGGSIIVGTDNAETLTGTSGHNQIEGKAGNDTLKGLDGNDILIGGVGDDRLEGGNGEDTYVADVGVDTIYEQAGNDTIKFGPGVTINDLDIYRLYQGMFSEHLVVAWSGGSIKVDQHFYDLATDRRVERILFDDGSVYSLITNSFVTKGTAAADTLVGEKWSLFGQNDTIYGYDGNDTINGEAGNDTIHGGNGDDLIEGKDGNDILNGDAGQDTLHGHAGNDTINGGAGNDILYEIYGGSDTLNGGDGVDTLDYSGNNSYAVTVNLETGIQTDTYSTPSSDTIANIENVLGSSGNDTIIGQQAANILSGANGNDVMYGRAGDDVLYGGSGTDTLYGEDGNDHLYGGSSIDTLYGGAGSDTFTFDAASAFSSIDKIKDFSLAQLDKLNIHDLLVGYDPVTSAIENFIQITTSGSNSIVKVDRDGMGTAYAMAQIATIEGTTGLTDELALLNAGHIVT